MEGILSFDIGSSSVKAMCVNRNGVWNAHRTVYGEKLDNTDILWQTMQKASNECLSKCKGVVICGIALTAQVGAYLLIKKGEKANSEIIGWQNADRKDLVSELLSKHDQSFFIKELGMPHPPLESYPIPFIMQLSKGNQTLQAGRDMLCCIKDFLYDQMTGVYATDPFSWRGIANTNKKGYSQNLLDELSFPIECLPPLFCPETSPGLLNVSAAKELGVFAGIPVYVGCNDFFAGLLGSVQSKYHIAFDVTGTSEHIGCFTAEIQPTDSLIAGPYLSDNICYGVTASSGDTLSWVDREFGETAFSYANPMTYPLLFPYLKGERTPLYKSNARGLIWGLESKHTTEDIYRATLEGVVFSLCHIFEMLPNSSKNSIQAFNVMGGAARIPMLNQLKADIFGLPVLVCEQSAGGALGAAMIAAKGLGWFNSYEEAQSEWLHTASEVMPNMERHEAYMEKFQVYSHLYQQLKELF